MNLRTLKKLSKRAAPLMQALGDRRELFPAGRGENSLSAHIDERKHWDRSAALYGDGHAEGTIVLQPRCRAGNRLPYVVMRQPYHPLRGTLMFGGMTGYETPEWDEETAWCALDGYIRDVFIRYDPREDYEWLLRKFRNPGDIFRAAEELIRDREVKTGRLRAGETGA